jgi:hypothetical protein
MSGDAGENLFLPMAFGFAIAVVLIVGAFFQDALVAVLRWVGNDVAPRVARAASRGVRGVAAGGRRRLAALGRSATGGGVRAAGAVRAAAAARPRFRSAGSDPAAAPPPEPDERPDLDELAAGPEPPDELLPELEDAAARRTALASKPGVPAPNLPMSSVHVYAIVEEFLAGGRTATVDALVRHLDRHFGTGRGLGLVESLARRGAVVIRRDPDRPTQIVISMATPSSR